MSRVFFYVVGLFVYSFIWWIWMFKPFSGDQSVQLKILNGNGKGNEKCAARL